MVGAATTTTTTVVTVLPPTTDCSMTAVVDGSDHGELRQGKDNVMLLTDNSRMMISRGEIAARLRQSSPSTVAT